MKTSMQEAWFNASPTVPFSFAGGEFSRSTKEMKDCITRDCESTTLHNTTAHFAPSARQNQFWKERAKKEEVIANSPRREYSPSGAGASIGASNTTASLLPKLKIYGAEVDLSLSLSSIRASPRHSQELGWLRTAGRKEYLRQRRLEPYTEDMDAAVFMPSSRRIGEHNFAGPTPFTPRQTPDYRRKTCHETMTTGVFPRQD
jgi:hypothetical protein